MSCANDDAIIVKFNMPRQKGRSKQLKLNQTLKQKVAEVKNKAEESSIKNTLISAICSKEDSSYSSARELHRNQLTVQQLKEELNCQSRLASKFEILENSIRNSSASFHIVEALLNLLTKAIIKKEEIFVRKDRDSTNKKILNPEQNDVSIKFYSFEQLKSMRKLFEEQKSLNFAKGGPTPEKKSNSVSKTGEDVEATIFDFVNNLAKHLASLKRDTIVPFAPSEFQAFCDNLPHSNVDKTEIISFKGCFESFQRLFGITSAQKTVTILLCICRNKNIFANQLQDRVGVFLRANNASVRVINFLSGLGVSSPIETLRRKEKLRHSLCFERLNNKLKPCDESNKQICLKRKRPFSVLCSDDFHVSSQVKRTCKGERTNVLHTTTNAIHIVTDLEAPESTTGLHGIPIKNSSAAWAALAKTSGVASSSLTFINHKYLVQEIRKPGLFLSFLTEISPSVVKDDAKGAKEQKNIIDFCGNRFIEEALKEHYNEGLLSACKCKSRDGNSGSTGDGNAPISNARDAKCACRTQDRRMRNADLLHMIGDDLKNVAQVANVWRELFDKIPNLVDMMSSCYVPHPGDCPSQGQLKRFMVAVHNGDYDRQFSAKEKQAILNLVPFVGPLHISLNGIQDLIIQFR